MSPQFCCLWRRFTSPSWGNALTLHTDLGPAAELETRDRARNWLVHFVTVPRSNTWLILDAIEFKAEIVQEV